MVQASYQIDPLRASLPEYSVDWRFLLPIRPGARILVLSDTGEDFSTYFSGLETQVITSRMNGTTSATDSPREGARADGGPPDLLKQPSFAAASFDAVVIPLGVPEALSGSSSLADQVDSWKRLLRPSGVLLLGFSNHWSFLRRGSRRGRAVAPSSITRLLKAAGFKRFSLYGAVPNLDKPAYILPLRRLPLQFFMRHRFLGRPAGMLLRSVPAPLLARLLPGFLPCYFLLAGT